MAFLCGFIWKSLLVHWNLLVPSLSGLLIMVWFRQKLKTKSVFCLIFICTYTCTWIPRKHCSYFRIDDLVLLKLLGRSLITVVLFISTTQRFIILLLKFICSVTICSMRTCISIFCLNLRQNCQHIIHQNDVNNWLDWRWYINIQ